MRACRSTESISRAVGRLGLVASLTFLSFPAWATVGPGDNEFEIDGDYGSVILVNGNVVDDGDTTTFSQLGSGKYWEHWAETAYMGQYSYKVRCTESPDTTNDRSEQKMLDQWDISDGVRYFSLSFYVPDFAPTPTTFFQFFCQWWQDPNRQPPLQLSWSSDDHVYLARRTEATGWDALYDGGVLQRNHWYHFLFAIDFGLSNTGSVAMYQMNQTTGAWEEVCNHTGITLGWATRPDGNPAQTQNFTWKVGTYRSTTPLTTRIYYDNIRYARLWAMATKNYLTGYHKNVMRLPFDEGSGAVAQDASGYDNDGELVNGPAWRSDGPSGYCLEFDGVNDHVRVPVDPVDFDTGNYLTAMGWFNTASPQVGTSILCMDEFSTSYKFRLYLISETEVSFDLRYPDNTVEWLTATLPMSVCDGRWHHLAGTYNRWESDGQRVKLYVDGYPVASSPGQDKPLWRGNNYLYVGKFSGEYFRGLIDEPAVYNYAMTAGDIWALCQQYTDVDESRTTPGAKLIWASPNPSRKSVAVEYVLDGSEYARLSVYDVAGRELVRLVDDSLPDGRYTVMWDGADRHGSPVAQGVYLLRLDTRHGAAMRKVTVLR